MKQTNENETTEPTAAAESRVKLRIYVASLADYNAGLLHGRWIDVTTDADEIRHQIDEMLAESTEAIAEEWAIHDHEGFNPFRLSEWHDLNHLAAIAAAVEEHGEIFLHFLHHVGYTDDMDEMKQEFHEQYNGEFDSAACFASELMHDTCRDAIEALPSVLQFCIDWERVAHEFELAGDIFTLEVGGRVHVFWGSPA